MRTLMVLPLVLFAAACGSSNDFGIPENPTLGDCEHGEVQVRAGISDAREGRDTASDWLEFSVEVANNAKGKEIVVKSIRIDPRGTMNVPYVFETVSRTFNRKIPENEESVFELPTTGKGVPSNLNQGAIGEKLIFVVSVSLESGDQPVIAEGRGAVLHRPYPSRVADEFARKFEWDLDAEPEYDALVEVTPTRWLRW